MICALIQNSAEEKDKSLKAHEKTPKKQTNKQKNSNLELYAYITVF